GLHLLDLLDHRSRQRPQASTGAHEHRLRDRERERQVEHERRALSRSRRHLDAPAELLDLRADDVPPDAASGYLGDLRRRAEARFEDAGDQRLVGRLVVGLEAALRDRLVAYALEIEAGAVVDELDRDLVADLTHGQRDLAGL